MPAPALAPPPALVLPPAPAPSSAPLPALLAGLASPTLAPGAAEQIVSQLLEALRPQLIAALTGAAPAAAATLPAAPALANGAPRPASLAQRQEAHLAALIERYTRRTQGSKRYAQTYRPLMADLRSMVGFRPSVKEMVYPIVKGRASGSRLWDIDGNEYIDLTCGFGVHLLGHNHPVIAEALRRQIEEGIELGPRAHHAGPVAELLTELTGMERVGFCTSGTEAVSLAIRLARAATGRARIVLFAGAYHGHADGTLAQSEQVDGRFATTPSTLGIPAGAVEQVLVLPYGEARSLEIVAQLGGELAAVLVEPVQSRNPGLQPIEFLRQLRQLTEQSGTVLIFDEMITGFRVHLGGAQAWCGVRADLATYGKILGGGLPIGAVAGRADLLDRLDGGAWRYGDASRPRPDITYFAGTFAMHPLAMATARAVLAHLKAAGPELQEELNRKTQGMARRLNALFQREAAPIEVVHFGSMFRFEVTGNRDPFFFHLAERGVYVWEGRGCFLSTAHTDEDVDHVVRAAAEAVREMQDGGFLPEPPPGGRPGASAIAAVSAAGFAAAPVAAAWATGAPVRATAPAIPAATPPSAAAASTATATKPAVVAPSTAPTTASAEPSWSTEPASPSRALSPFGRRRAPAPGAAEEAPAPFVPRTGPVDFSLYFFGDYDPAQLDDKYRLVLDAARFADERGFRAVWIPERHFHSFGGLSPNPSVLAAALAATTQRLHVRAGSVVVPLHHPIRIAEEWSVVDNLSKGRVGLSIATGWHANDFVLAPGAFADRRARMLEGIEQVRALWSEGSLEVPGPDGKRVAVTLVPRPVQAELPVWVAVVNNPETYQLAGRLGFGVLTSLMGQSPEDLGRNLALYRAALAEHGHPESRGHVTLLLHAFLGADLEETRRRARGPFLAYLRSAAALFSTLGKLSETQVGFDDASPEDLEYLYSAAYERYVREAALIGTPESCRPVVERMRALGVDEVSCLVDFGLPAAEVLGGLTHLEALRRSMQPRREPGAAGEGGGAGAGDQLWPVSPAQRQLSALSALLPGGAAAYNLAHALELRGEVQVAALDRALQQLAARHEAVRTVLSADGEQQRVKAEVRLPLDLDDLTQLPDGARDAAAAELLAQESLRPFVLTEGPMLRARLIRLSAERHLLVLAVHHILIDGWSLGLLGKELFTLYAAACRQAAAEPDAAIDAQLPPAAQFHEWARAQAGYLRSPQRAADEAFWLAQLTPPPPDLELPADRPRAALPSLRAARQLATLDAELVGQVKAFSRRNGCTPFMTLCATFLALLHRVTGQAELLLGCPVSGRVFQDEGSTAPSSAPSLASRASLASVVGYCTHLLPLRSRSAGQESFLELLHATRRNLLEAYEHQSYPYAELVERLRGAQNLVEAPLLRATFNIDPPPDLPALPGLAARLRHVPVHFTQFELALNAIEEDGALLLSCDHDAERFDAATILRLLEQWRLLIAAAVAEPGRPVARLPLVPERQHQQLLAWNATAAPYPSERCIHELFEEQVARTPDAVAVACGDQRVTFRELNARANQLAHHLQRLGVGPKILVGLCVERSIDMVVGLLGILKAGGAYVPLDPAYPQARLSYLVEDSQASVLLTWERLRGRLGASRAWVFCLDTEAASLRELPDENPRSGAGPDDLAYVMYTSGSTGNPKGVMAPHRGAINRFAWMWSTYPFAADEVCPQKTNLSFGDSVWEIFGPLLQGVRLEILPDDVVRDVPRLVAALAACRASRLVVVPSLLRALLALEIDLAARLPRLRLWVSSGEALVAELAQQFRERLPDRLLLNLYGSSEVAADATCYPVTGAPQGRVPIGRPIANTQAYVLDPHRAPLPIGSVGELYIGGVGVAHGYLHRPELTEERFLPSPFGEGRLFRTGDLARVLADGNLEYLGRVDRQVKIRGFRIELGEIEALLSRHPQVAACVVSAREVRPGERRLAGYVVPRDGAALALAGLREHLQHGLPEYMVPQDFVVLAQLPLDPNGKVDHKALPVPDGAQLAEAFVAPRTPLEEQLAGIFARALRRAQVGRGEDFFALGGDSLLTLQVSALAREAGLELAPWQLFAHHTVAALAAALASPAEQAEGAPTRTHDNGASHGRDEAKDSGAAKRNGASAGEAQRDADEEATELAERLSRLFRDARVEVQLAYGATPAPRSALIPLSAQGARTPLFLVHPIEGTASCYRRLAALLGPEQPVYGLEACALHDEEEAPLRDVREIAARCLEALRRVQAQGPYRLGGWSFGASVVHEMARRLRAEGHEVASLILIDPTEPREQPSPDPDLAARALTLLAAREGLPLDAAAIRAMDPERAFARVAELAAAASDLPSPAARRYFQRLVAVFHANWDALARHRPAAGYDGEMTLVRARAGADAQPLDLGWGAFAGGPVSVRWVPGNHFTMIRPPHVEILAEVLRGELA